MLPIVQVGPLALQVPGLVLLVGLWMGLTFAERYSARRGIDSNTLYNLVFISLIAGVLGARVTYAIQYPAAFISSPLSLFSLNPGLLDPWGGVAFAFLAGLVYAQRKRLGAWQVLDALTPALAVLAVALGLSNLASGSAFGAPTDLPWGIELWGAQRHPTQLYEILGAVLILVAVRPGGALFRQDRQGVYFLSFLALSAALRLFLEAFRGDSTFILGGLRAAQVIAWLVLAASLWGLGKRLAGESAQPVKPEGSPSGR